MKPSLKYWIFILGIAGVIFGVILASVVGSWLNLTPAEQQLVAGLAEKILPYPLMGSIILAGIICSLVTLLFRSYIIPILKMAEARTPEVEAALKDLLERFAENDLVPLAAVVDGIMREPSPANLSLVRDKIQNMADPQVKKILLSRVEIGTGKETP